MEGKLLGSRKDSRMRINRTSSGIFTVAPTPFDDSGSIDWKSLDKLIDFYHEVGVDGITILGLMGEASKLESSEAQEIVARVIGRAEIPVVVGVTSPGFAAMRALSTSAMDAGAAGVMIAPPNTLRTDDQVVAYYAGAAQAIGEDTPFYIQDYPMIFSVLMSNSVISRIVNENANCIGLKHEEWPGLEKITELRRLELEGEIPQISILCGNGGLFLDFELERGADGAMTGYCFPEMLIEMSQFIAEGNRNTAHDVFDAHLPLIRYEQQQGIGLSVRKYVFTRRGIFATDKLRSPGRGLSEGAVNEVEFLLKRLAQSDPRAADLY